MGYDADRLSLESQAPGAGPKKWVYLDSGGESVATYEGAGYFANAKKYGVTVGDRIEVINRSTPTAAIVYSGKFTAVQDTGGTTGTITLDTGNL